MRDIEKIKQEIAKSQRIIESEMNKVVALTDFKQLDINITTDAIGMVGSPNYNKVVSVSVEIVAAI